MLAKNTTEKINSAPRDAEEAQILAAAAERKAKRLIEKYGVNIKNIEDEIKKIKDAALQAEVRGSIIWMISFTRKL